MPSMDKHIKSDQTKLERQFVSCRFLNNHIDIYVVSNQI